MKLPFEVKTETLGDKIYALHIKQAEKRRSNGIGGGIIGKPCARELLLRFRWALPAESFPGRILRLFGTGKREEIRVIQELKDLGLTVVDTIDNEQIRVEHFGGHVSGYIDAVVLGIPEAPKSWHIVEIKTANEKNFEKIKAEGVRKAKVEHYAQMQTYMGLEKIKKAIYICINKNTDEIYTERVKFESAYFKALIAKAKTIIQNEAELPPKINQEPSGYGCMFCSQKEYCHQTEPIFPDMNCRTCAHSTPTLDGKWQCSKHDKSLTVEEQKQACDQHMYLPMLVIGYEPFDVTDGNVIYKKRGKTFVNRPGLGIVTDGA